MSAHGGWRRFFRLSESKRHRQREVDDELRFHVDSLVERHVRAGMEEKEARRLVMSRFSDYGTTRAVLIRGREVEVRMKTRRLFFDGLWQDVRVSWRQLSRRPGFAVWAVVTLGLGIGASTTMFSVVNGVLLDPLPYPDSERLVWVGYTNGGAPEGTNPPEFRALKGETRTLEKYAAFARQNYGVLVGDRSEEVKVAGVTEDYLDVFGASPVLGRAFSEDDFQPGATSVALLSHAAWQRYWGADPQILGTVVTNTQEHNPFVPWSRSTIIGVMPPYMDDQADFWVPLHVDTGWYAQEWQFENPVLSSVGKLRPGSDVAALQAEADRLVSRLASEYPRYYSGGPNEGRGLGAVSLLDNTVGSYRTGILLLFAGACLLLGIATMNLTALFLSRALDRRQELAVRVSLGGGRSHILRHLAMETVSLSVLGGALGLILARGCLAALRAFAPAGLPRLDNLSLNLSVVFFALAIALTSGLVCALASLPARRSGALDLSLRETGRTGTGRDTARLRGLLVSAQVSLAVILLVGTGLLSASLAKLRHVDPGFEAEGLTVMAIRFPTTYETNQAKGQLLGDMVRRIDAIPGVVSASWTADPPLFWRYWAIRIRTEETMDLPEEQLPKLGTHPVGPGFFTTMGIPVLRGRGITEGDNVDVTPVVVVDELAATRLWPSQDPIGRRLAIQKKWHTVVGVAGRVHQTELSGDEEPEIYIPSAQAPFFFPTTAVTIRSELPSKEAAGALRGAVSELDPMVLIRSISSAEDKLGEHLRTPRFIALLGSGCSLSALFITLAAIVGLMSYWVSALTREVGLRMALGAQGRQVLWAVLRRCLKLILVGLAAGLALAVGTSRLMNALLFDVSPLDLRIYALVGIGLGVSALLASLVPALRATHVEPTVALRGD